MARISKDVAAGAVLISAVFALLIGIVLFWQIEGFINMYKFFSEEPLRFILFIFSCIFAVLYIILGPIGIKGLLYKKKGKKLKSISRSYWMN